MNRPVRRSLRRRMAILAFAAVFVPVVVLLAVVLVTRDEQVTGTPEGGVVEVTVDAAPSILVPLVALLLAVPVALAVSTWAGRLLRPLTDITAAIERVEAESLDERLRLRMAPQEVQALGDAFDRMLERLAVASAAQQQLLEDTGHQLRTPLSTASLAIEVLAERFGEDGSGEDPDLERARRAVERLTATVTELLADARSRQRRVAQVDNDLTVLARRVVGDIVPTSSPSDDPEAPVRVRLTTPSRCHAAVDGRAVERALANLLDNAVRLSPPGAVVDVVVGERDGRVFVSVEDDGPGIASDEQPCCSSATGAPVAATGTASAWPSSPRSPPTTVASRSRRLPGTAARASPCGSTADDDVHVRFTSRSARCARCAEHPCRSSLLRS